MSHTRPLGASNAVMTRGHRKTDQLFAEFCRSGDPAALGAVFDRTAAELLHVAVWLCGNRTDAEDLLQRTFVQAIEARGQFAPGRPVLPWLCGILGNHARHLRRERARVLPGREVAGEPDPAVTASEAEFAAAVQRRVQAIEAPYREVLELHLEQGLNSKQIGERLGRPAGTVRTQLVRALELLRKKLPHGFVAGAAAATLPDAARLAAVKDTVLATAKAAAPAATATATGILAAGGVLMGKKLLVSVLTLLLLLGSGGYLMSLADRSQLPIDSAATADASPVVPTPTPHPVPAQRTELAAPTHPREAPTTGQLVVHVQWDGLAPASAMPVFVSFAIADAPLLDRMQATTDARGQCAFAALRPGTWWVQPLVGEPVRAQIEVGETADVLVTAKALAMLRGMVVDEADRPVADAEIWATGPDAVRDAAVAAHSDADGTFALPVSRAVFVGARQRGHAQSAMFFFYPQSKHNDVTLRLQAAEARLRGIVLDAAGAPVPQARIRVGAVSATVRRGFNPGMENDPYGIDVLSDAAGRFAVDDLPAGTTAVRVWADGFAAATQWVRLAATGTSECTVVVQQGARVQGTVRDDAGAPIAGALVEYGDKYDFDRVATRSSADGSYELSGLPRSLVLAAQDDEGRREVRSLRLPADKPGRWDPHLRDGKEITGRVVDADGRPITDGSVGYQGRHSRAHGSMQLDAQGRFSFQHLEEDRYDLQLAVANAFLRSLLDVKAGTRDLLIQLTADETPSVHLRLRTVDADRRGRGGVLRLTRSDDTNQPGGESRNGEFELGPLLPGTLTLSLVCGEAGSDWSFPLTTVTVAAGEKRDLGEFFVPASGRVHTRVVDGDGQPLRPQSCTMYSLDGNRVARFDGDTGTAPAGRWLLTVLAADDARQMYPDGSAIVDVFAGRTTEAEVVPRTAASVSFQLSAEDPQLGGMARILVRDAAGTLVLVEHAYLPSMSCAAHGLAPGRYRLEAFGPGRHRGELAFDLADSDRKLLTVKVR